jgi:hypothetical protein
MSKPTPADRTPHLLHVTPRGMHLHYALGASIVEIQRAGKAARAFAGKDLVKAATDPVPVRHPLGWFRFGVDHDGVALVGAKLKPIL